MNAAVPSHFIPVPLEKSYRLMNHGPTVLVSANHAGQDDVMAVAWACPLDYGDHTKVSVVLDKATRTRELVEASGRFALQLPPRALADLTYRVGSVSAREVPDKLQRLGVSLFRLPHEATPLVDGCVAWLLCRVLPEPHNQQTYDLFIGEVEAAWADERVFSDGRWHFDSAPTELRTLHHVAGGHFLLTGDSVQATL